MAADLPEDLAVVTGRFDGVWDDVRFAWLVADV